MLSGFCCVALERTSFKNISWASTVCRVLCKAVEIQSPCIWNLGICSDYRKWTKSFGYILGENFSDEMLSVSNFPWKFLSFYPWLLILFSLFNKQVLFSIFCMPSTFYTLGVQGYNTKHRKTNSHFWNLCFRSERQRWEINTREQNAMQTTG